jgi:hypothetical protein
MNYEPFDSHYKEPYEVEILNGQVEYAISVLKSMRKRILDNPITTDEFNRILDKKIEKLESEIL